MKSDFKNIILLLLIFSTVLWAQQSAFEVTSLEGVAKVQHSAQNIWDKISVGDQIKNEDIIETDFQTKIVLKYNQNCILILGSNSKVLVDYEIRETGDTVKSDFSLTLFTGGLLAKVQKDSYLKVFTSNAIAEADSGTLSVVVDGKNGESGFQVIKGNVDVRNIIQNRGIRLRTGLTTIVLPNKDPTPTLYMTNRHVSVLKHFFGAEYIQTELDSSGITPTEEKKGNRLSFSRQFSSKISDSTNNEIYRSLFDINRIYGSIIDDQMNESKFYESFASTRNVKKRKGLIEFGCTNFFNDERIISSFSLSLGYSYRFIEAALRLSLNEKRNSHYEMKFSTAQSIFDKLDYLSIGNIPDSMFIQMGPIKNLTLGNALVVDQFRNKHPNSLYSAAGVFGSVKVNDHFGLKGFVNDITAPYVGGLSMSFEPSAYYLYAGYYFDADQHESSITNSNYVYCQPVTNIQKSSRIDPVHIYEIDLGTDLALYYNFNAKLFVEFAQKLNSGNDGIVVRMPYFLFDLPRTSFGFGFLMEFGRLLSGQFDQFYMSQRSFVKTDGTGQKILESPNSILSPRRSTLGVSLFYKMNPVKGFDIALSGRQNLKEKKSFVMSTETGDSSFNARPDYSYSLRLAINDSLVKFVNYFGLYLGQNHATLFPDGSSVLRSWNTEAGIELLTNPLFYNVAFDTRCRYFYYDHSKRSNNLINKEDHIVEWYFGIKWGFL